MSRLFVLCFIQFMSIRDAFARSAVSKIEVDNRTRQNKNAWACNDHTFKLGEESRCFLSLCRNPSQTISGFFTKKRVFSGFFTKKWVISGFLCIKVSLSGFFPNKSEFSTQKVS